MVMFSSYTHILNFIISQNQTINLNILNSLNVFLSLYVMIIAGALKNVNIKTNCII